jgi:putative SOS response-associated peptidase YedK
VCGRYTQTLSADDLAAAMSARDDTGGDVHERYNVAPTTTMPIVTARGADPAAPTSAAAAPSSAPTSPRTASGAAPDGGEPAGPARGSAAATESGEPGEPDRPEAPGRVLRLARWGLVPSWAKDVSIGSRLINARSETIAEKPAFRRAFASRRCLVPATGYYEWHRAAGSRRGQPYYIHRGEHPGVGPVLVFAGLYEVWRGGAEPLITFTILTTGPAVGLEFLHDRSPVVLPASAWDRWLDPDTADQEALRGLLAPAPAGVVTAYPVGSAVGDVRIQGAGLIEPVELSSDAPERTAPADRSAPSDESGAPGRPRAGTQPGDRRGPADPLRPAPVQLDLLPERTAPPA